MFGVHVLLAIGLAAVAGALSLAGVFAAFVLVFAVMWGGSRWLTLSRYVGRVRRGVAFMLWFGWAVLRASVDVGVKVLGRRVRVSPAIVRVPLTVADERLASAIACLVSLTPGTLALDRDPDAGVLYVHVLDAGSQAEVIAEVHQIARRLQEWLDGGPSTAREERK